MLLVTIVAVIVGIIFDRVLFNVSTKNNVSHSVASQHYQIVLTHVSETNRVFCKTLFQCPYGIHKFQHSSFHFDRCKDCDTDNLNHDAPIDALPHVTLTDANLQFNQFEFHSF